MLSHLYVLCIFAGLCVTLHTVVHVCMLCVWHVPERVCAPSLSAYVHVCEGTMEGLPTENTTTERCHNEFVTESVNLKRKGTVEGETFPRRPESVRLIKSQDWSEGLHTEPESCKGRLG